MDIRGRNLCPAFVFLPEMKSEVQKHGRQGYRHYSRRNKLQPGSNYANLIRQHVKDMLCLNACRRRNMCIEVTRAAQLPLGRGWEFGQQCRGVLGAPWRAKQASSAICRRSCVSVARSCLGSAL